MNRSHQARNRRHRRTAVILLGLLGGSLAARPTPAASVRVLPSAIEVRSPFTSDGRLEFLRPRDLSDEGIVVGSATDLHLDYDYQVAWYWSPENGLRVADPTNGKKRWVADPNNRKVLRSECQVVTGRTAYCTDDVGQVLYAYSEAGGFTILDRGDPEALDLIDRAFSDEGLERFTPIQLVWKAANERGDAGILANAPGIDSDPGQRHPVGLVLSPATGWQLLSSLDPRLDIGADGINDPQAFNRSGDALLNQGLSTLRQEIYLLDGRSRELLALGPGPNHTSVVCRYLTDDRRTCGNSFEGTYESNPADRVYVTWAYDPEHGVRQIAAPADSIAHTPLPNGDVLVNEKLRGAALEWARYSPQNGRRVRLLSRRNFGKFFPRGTRRLIQASTEYARNGDLLITITGRLHGRSLTRYVYYFAATGRLVDVWDLIREAEWVDDDRPSARFQPSRELELLLLAAVNSHGDSLWLTLLDGRPRTLVLSP